MKGEAQISDTVVGHCVLIRGIVARVVSMLNVGIIVIRSVTRFYLSEHTIEQFSIVNSSVTTQLLQVIS